MWSFFFYATMALFVFVCLILILLVLIQKGRGGGLSSAFGGASGNTAFGSKTGDVLTWATSIVFGVFILSAVALNLLASPHTATTNTPPTPIGPSDLPNSVVPPPTTMADTAPTSHPSAAPTTLP